MQSVSSLFTDRLLKTGVHSEFFFCCKKYKICKTIIYYIVLEHTFPKIFFGLLNLQAAKMATSCSHYFGAACTSQSTAIEMKENAGIKS